MTFRPFFRVFFFIRNDAAGEKTAAGAGARWMSCAAGDVVAFSVEPRGKLRHQDSHEPLAHHLYLVVDGWLEIGPVSVDRVGVYFRYASVRVPSFNVDGVCRTSF